jgi:ABC-type sugar transport system ATPase subunit
MTESARARIEASVPFAVTRPDRIDARRYYDPEFFELEKERLWPHVWQMACRLQEIEKPGDFFVYEIFDQSVIVVRVDEALSGLGFTPDEIRRAPASLSGGEQTRAALARLVISNPDLLLLDEPTNHLDIGALEWLEEHLRRRSGSLLVASHDRADAPPRELTHREAMRREEEHPHVGREVEVGTVRHVPVEVHETPAGLEGVLEAGAPGDGG